MPLETRSVDASCARPLDVIGPAEVFAGARRPAVLSFPVDRRRDTFVRSGVDPDSVAYPVTRDRLAGYRDAARDLGIDWSQVPVGVCRTTDEAEAREVMRHLLASAPDLDAVPDFRQLLYEHACEGAYGAPEYGGNRDGAGWEAIRFPGDVQPRGYTDEEVAGRE